MTDLPERARKLAKQVITEQNETYSPETREEEEAELSKLASLILAFGQAERERTIEEAIAFYDTFAPGRGDTLRADALKERKDADAK
jgi:hypothetical protein